MAAWWSTTVDAPDARPGTLVRWTFAGDFNPVMEIVDVDEPSLLVWRCVDGHEPWQESTFRFETATLDDGRSRGASGRSTRSNSPMTTTGRTTSTGGTTWRAFDCSVRRVRERPFDRADGPSGPRSVVGDRWGRHPHLRRRVHPRPAATRPTTTMVPIVSPTMSTSAPPPARASRCRTPVTRRKGDPSPAGIVVTDPAAPMWSNPVGQFVNDGRSAGGATMTGSVDRRITCSRIFRPDSRWIPRRRNDPSTIPLHQRSSAISTMQRATDGSRAE